MCPSTRLFRALWQLTKRLPKLHQTQNLQLQNVINENTGTFQKKTEEMYKNLTPLVQM